MIDLLLITDVARLRKVFSRLNDEREMRLRIANSLEKGGEEIVAEKPAMVFVQTHLSGLSADIILMHLKKQLGRKRTRFVLLSPPDQVGPDILKLYQGHIDTSLDDKALAAVIQETVATLQIKAKKTAEIKEPPAAPPVEPVAPAIVEQPPQTAEEEQMLQLPEFTSQEQPAQPQEASLEEQGITYSPRPKLSVYSEFTGSFEKAVNEMQPAEPSHSADEPEKAWHPESFEIPETPTKRSKSSNFLMWLAPVVVAVVVVTILQNKQGPKEKVSIDLAQKPAVVAPPAPQTPITPAGKPEPKAQATSKPTPAGEMQLSDKAVMSAIAEGQAKTEKPRQEEVASRPSTLPNFIPRAGLDKSYTAENPGWERYKGRVTEFRVYRQNTAIKAIQTIDRGGQGVPEDFMKSVLKQVTKKPAFVMESSEKKDGYEIQRGRIADNIKVVYYRDQKGGTLRAFVLTWK